MKEKISRKSDTPAVDVQSVQNTDNLIVKRKGGGSIIEQRPLFSNDGETLYIVWKHVIRAYSTQTGDFVREFEATDNRIAGIVMHPQNFNIIIGCTDNGELSFWSCQSGIITKKLKLNMENSNKKVSTFHIANYKSVKGNDICQVLISYFSNFAIYVNLFDLETGQKMKSTLVRSEVQEYYIDIIGNRGDNLIALLHDVNLHILNPARNLVDKLHKTGRTGRTPTCIAGHPDEECVATGDSTGRVVVWRSLFQTRPYTATYHWHTLPVTEIVFSKSGGHMYTGGGECVLVKWTLANPQHKSFLPRLPAPIKHLTIAPDNLYVAVSTLDNGIVVVNPQRKLTSVIQNFTWGVALSSQDLFPAGLVVDPRTNSLVLNSRTGHVQFYNTQTKSLLYNINITAQNFLTQERSVIIVNTEVTKIAMNQDGTWMATVEERNDKISSTEVRLKFWSYDLKNQIFSLNTSIELPHENGVNALEFQPNISLDDSIPMAVTTGRDKKFKIWSLTESSSIHKQTKHWRCYSIGDYRELPATDAAFSVDGSLLAIAFHTSLTIWVPENCDLKCSLSYSRYPHALTRVEFGKQEACHLVVVGSAYHLAVWNILSLNMVWSVPLNLATLAADPKSVYMAAFTTDNTLYVFSPQNSTPVYSRKYVTEKGSIVLASTFVPNLQEKRDPSFKQWQQKSQLYFLDSNQELLTLEPESEVSISLENLSTRENVPATAFARLLAPRTTSGKDQSDPFVHEHLGISGKGIVEELLSVSAHTLPPMKMLCGSFVLSLMAKNSLKGDSRQDRGSRTDEGEGTRDSEDSEDETKSKHNGRQQQVDENYRRITEDSPSNETDVHLISHDWTFLSTILPAEKIDVQ